MIIARSLVSRQSLETARLATRDTRDDATTTRPRFLVRLEFLLYAQVRKDILPFPNTP